MAICLVLDPKDNVAVAVEQVESGETVELSNGRVLKSLNNIPFAHKIAISPIAKRDKVFKYGEVIGEATEDIEAGQHVHVHNIRSLRVKRQEAES